MTQICQHFTMNITGFQLISISQIITHVSYGLHAQSEVTVSSPALLYRHMGC